jgi:hypothetical protein
MQYWYAYLDHVPLISFKIYQTSPILLRLHTLSLKGTVSRDFRPSVFKLKEYPLGP